MNLGIVSKFVSDLLASLDRRLARRCNLLVAHLHVGKDLAAELVPQRGLGRLEDRRVVVVELGRLVLVVS